MDKDLAAAPKQQLPEPVAFRHQHEDGWEYYDAPTGEDCNKCQALYTADQLRTAIAAERERNPWRMVMDDALVTAHLGVATDDPYDDLNRLLAWHHDIWLDPAVSSDAQALIDRGAAASEAELSTLRQQLAEAVRDGWTDAEADAARLALELECLLTDKDVPMPALSRWWDSAHEALELHRARFRTAIAAQGEAK